MHRSGLQQGSSPYLPLGEGLLWLSHHSKGGKSHQKVEWDPERLVSTGSQSIDLGTAAPASLCAVQRKLRNRALGRGYKFLPDIPSPLIPYWYNLDYIQVSVRPVQRLHFPDFLSARADQWEEGKSYWARIIGSLSFKRNKLFIKKIFRHEKKVDQGNGHPYTPITQI